MNQKSSKFRAAEHHWARSPRIGNILNHNWPLRNPRNDDIQLSLFKKETARSDASKAVQPLGVTKETPRSVSSLKKFVPRILLVHNVNVLYHFAGKHTSFLKSMS